MKGYIPKIYSVESTNFGYELSSAISTLESIMRGFAGQDIKSSTINLCETLIRGCEASKKERLSWQEACDYEKYSAFEKSEAYCKLLRTEVRSVVNQLGEFAE